MGVSGRGTARHFALQDEIPWRFATFLETWRIGANMRRILAVAQPVACGNTAGVAVSTPPPLSSPPRHRSDVCSPFSRWISAEPCREAFFFYDIRAAGFHNMWPVSEPRTSTLNLKNPFLSCAFGCVCVCNVSWPTYFINLSLDCVKGAAWRR